MGNSEHLTITYLHNSGITIEKDDSLIIIDYAMHTPGPHGEGLAAGIVPEELIREKNQVLVLVTHRHIDHYNKNILEWEGRFDNLTFIFSDDIETDKDVIFMSQGQKLRMGDIEILACASNDTGISFWLKIGETTIFHAGDMSLWYWASEYGSKELRENRKNYRIAKTSYLKALESVKELPVDIAFCPVNPLLGGHYFEGAEIFCEKVRPKLFVPVHFGMSFEVPSLFKENADTFGAKVWAIRERGDWMVYCPEKY